jgi:hypothetical protein
MHSFLRQEGSGMASWPGALFGVLIVCGIVVARLGYRMTSRCLLNHDMSRRFLLLAGLVELAGFCLVCVGVAGVGR